MDAYSQTVETLTKDWFRRCRESQMVHYEYGTILERRHLFFGIPAVVLSTIVGTAVFSSLETHSGDANGRIIFGLLSMLAAAVAALQTFLNLSDRAAKHKASGAAYGAIRRELELLKTLPPETSEQMRLALEAIKNKMDDLAAASPSIPSRFKAKIDARLKSKLHNRVFNLEPPNQVSSTPTKA
ncbi:MAG: SLATT domain-containing protein [Chthoniobacterales bacterium]